MHGDDVVLMLSQSGETSEVVQLLPCIRSLGAPIIGITASDHSTVGRNSKVVLELGRLEEACSLGLAPSTTTTAMLALGDALALVLSKLKGLWRGGFCTVPSGRQLGKQLSKVDELHAATRTVPRRAGVEHGAGSDRRMRQAWPAYRRR